MNCPPIFNVKEPNCKTEIIDDPILSEERLIDISTTASSNYFMVFSRLPNYVYFIQDFTLPSTTNRTIAIPRPMADSVYKTAGHAQDYEDLNFDFLVDENFKNYFSILNWMRENERRDYFKETISNASLFILNNAKIPIIEVVFKDVFPTMLGSIAFMNQDATPLVANAMFANHHYDVRYLDGSARVGYEWEAGISGLATRHYPKFYRSFRTHKHVRRFKK